MFSSYISLLFLFLSLTLNQIAKLCDKVITDGPFVETSDLHLGLSLLLCCHPSVARHDNWDGKVTQSERVVIRNTQAIGIDVSMSHSVVVKELEQAQSFIVKVYILLLSENLLTAETLSFSRIHKILLSPRPWSVKHVDEWGQIIVDECDVVKNRIILAIDNKDLFVHIWEELLDAICAIIFQKLHQLGLIDYV